MALPPDFLIPTSSDIENQLIPSQPPSPPKKAHQHSRFGQLRPVSSRPALQALSNNTVLQKDSIQTKRRYGNTLGDEARTVNRADDNCRELLLKQADGTTSIKRPRVSRKRISVLQDLPTEALTTKQFSPKKLHLTLEMDPVEDSECLEVVDHCCVHLDEIFPGEEFSMDLGEVPLPSIESPGPEDVVNISIPSSSTDLDPMFASDDSFAQPRIRHRSKNVSPSDPLRMERLQRRFGTVMSSSNLGLDLEDDDDITLRSDIPAQRYEASLASEPDTLRPAERGYSIAIYKLPEQEECRTYVLYLILAELAESYGDESLSSRLLHNQHHAMTASHIIHARLAYNNGGGILGFLETPTLTTALWHKIERARCGDSVDHYDHMYGVLYRLVEQGTIEEWKEVDPYHKGEASVLYRVFHDQLMKVDHTFQEFEESPVVVETSNWITSLLHVEQQLDSTNRSVLEMLINEAREL